MTLAVLDHLTDAIVVIDHRGQPLFGNGQAHRRLEHHLDSMWTTDPASPYQVLDPQYIPLKTHQLPLRRLLAGEQLQDEELLLTTTNRAEGWWVSISGSPCPGEARAAAVMSVRDISLRKQGQAKILRQALHDELTDLPNRNRFMEQVSDALAQGGPPQAMAILFIDLDRFKSINDNLGHWVGNQLLTQLGDRLRPYGHAHAAVARLGGDEFALLLQGLTNSDSAIQVAKQLREEIIQPFHLPPHSVYIDASIGIALGPASYGHGEDWLRDADAAMYQIKHAPDQHWQIFDRDLRVQHDQQLQAETSLRQALDREELRLHYQPIVTISTQAVIGFEALVRWQHPQRGLLPPGDFIDTAETTGLIIPLGWWVLQEACRQMQAWTKAYPAMADFTISVNMSSKQFSLKYLVEKVKHILATTGFAAHRLKLEITEGVLIDHSDSIIDTLKQLKAMGIGLSVDDFGTGYSSLSYLHRFPFDCLKIDRSFIENADQDYEKLEILQSVVRLAWNLGLEVVAEGIETQRHYAQLKALRCEAGQGYLFSRPLPPEAVEHMLAQELAGEHPIRPNLDMAP